MTALLGYVAGTLTTFSFLFQVIQTLRTKSAKDINLAMYIVIFIGGSLWLIYSILLGLWPMIAANAVSLIFIATILLFKIIFG